MEKNRILIAVILVVCMLLGLSSCRLEDSYKEFVVKGISDNNKEYFTSEEFDFARLEDVIIIPTIKEINHGKYRIFVSAYSEKGEGTVNIDKVTIKESNTDLFNYDLDDRIIFEKKHAMYEGTLEAGIFTEEMIEIFDGKEFNIVVKAGLLLNDEYFSKEITCEIKVKIYQSFVCPT